MLGLLRRRTSSIKKRGARENRPLEGFAGGFSSASVTPAGRAGLRRDVKEVSGKARRFVR
ncbi:MAG: hypothetical protein A2Y69_15075 [Candidatus Aminicenantes bacterium RBG_13_59_9]|nr:MAG: hypothetical protein A2Y69_15075 [Candidatus Aminicenantes bacterium RBG_13_59_9]